nr:ATP-binding protein [Candidatus Cyanaurora vandensis]
MSLSIFWESLRWRRQAGRTVLYPAQHYGAFANTSGGKLLIGVDDQRRVVGIDEDELLDLQDRITAIAFDRFKSTSALC